MLRESGHEHLRGCITVPVRDAGGTVTQIVGYRVGRAREQRGTAATLALDGLPAAVWNPGALGASEVIVPESLLDALTWWRAGFTHVIAAAGPDPLESSPTR